MPINQRIIGNISLINDTAPLIVTYKLGHFQRLLSYLTKEMLYNPTEQMGCWRREITETKLGLENPWNFTKIHVFQKPHRLEDPQISCMFIAYSRNLPSAIYGKLRHFGKVTRISLFFFYKTYGKCLFMNNNFE